MVITKKTRQVEELRRRIQAVRPHMPRMYMRELIKKHPKFKNISLVYKVGNVVALKCTDEKITKTLEELFKPKEDANSI